MTREVEAIYEDGVLKPAEPLPFAERERVTVRVSNSPERVKPINYRTDEMAWIGANARSYRGEYVALQGNQLVSHGTNGRAVIAEARAKGIEQPLIYHVPDDFGEERFELF